MKLMLSMRGDPEQLPYLPEIASLGAGIELGGYGLIGIQSDENWQMRFGLQQEVRRQFSGSVALHGPFVGMEYNHIDYMMRDVINRRLDMTFEAALKLKARRVILHSGYTQNQELFKLQSLWLERNLAFWRQEILRWAGAGIEIALENETEHPPDLLVSLVTPLSDSAWISATCIAFPACPLPNGYTG